MMKNLTKISLIDFCFVAKEKRNPLESKHLLVSVQVIVIFFKKVVGHILFYSALLYGPMAYAKNW